MNPEALVLTLLGALVGAVVSPACELALARVVTNEFDRIKAGLVLLCAGNAVWLLSSPLFQLAKEHPLSLAVVVLLYGLSIAFFIAAFRAFNAGLIHSELARFLGTLRYLTAGNLVWVFSEIIEAPLAFLGIDDFPYLAAKYLILAVAAILFGRAAYEAWKQAAP